MNIAEIITLISFILILIVIVALYFVNTLKINKKEGKSKGKDDKIKTEAENQVIVEQKPVAVGIIEEKKYFKQDESDFAPFREQKPELTEKEKIKKEVSNLTPEMKKIIVSDLLKPKF